MIWLEKTFLVLQLASDECAEIHRDSHSDECAEIHHDIYSDESDTLDEYSVEEVTESPNVAENKIAHLKLKLFVKY